MSVWSPITLSLAACVSTTAGGLLVFVWRERVRGLLAFGAGTVLGVVTLHLLPESIELARRSGWGPVWTVVAAAGGLGSLFTIDRWAHRHPACRAGRPVPRSAAGAMAGQMALVGHSLVDGAGIGLAFQASPGLGLSVALAVVAHDFCDGLNTVGLMLSRRHERGATLGLLLLNALAPAIGATVVSLFTAPPVALALALGTIGGCLLHIMAADLLPQAFACRGAPARWASAALVGCGLAFAIFVPHGAG